MVQEHATAELTRHAGELLGRVRAERPRVHVLTNFVAMNVSANVLLAVGAVPSMTFRPAAVRDFVATSRALVVNLGMLDAEREAAIGIAVPAATELGRPWLLDPVKVERSGGRAVLAVRLLDERPALLRGNAGEIAALAELCGAAGAAALARQRGLAVAATGAVDLVADGARGVEIANGSPLMDRVTAMGCAASALLGAFLAVEPDPWRAAVCGLLVFDIAGELAAARARGPGSFQVELLDALDALDAEAIAARARLR